MTATPTVAQPLSAGDVSLRDWFAVQVFSDGLAKLTLAADFPKAARGLAMRSHIVADAMLAARAAAESAAS